jgi:hypothetical protein
VLNASERGIAFQAANPLRRTDPMGLSLSPCPGIQITLAAEFKWLDETRRSGGLQFSNLSAGIAEQIRVWLESNEGPQPSPGEAGACQYDAEETRSPSSGTRGKPAPTVPLSHLVHAAPPPLSDSTASRPGLPLTQKNSANWYAAASRSQSLRSFATGFLICLFALTPVMLFIDYHSEVGDSLIRLGVRLGGDTSTLEPLSLPGSSVPAPPDLSDSLPSFSVGSRTPEKVPAEDHAPLPAHPATPANSPATRVYSKDSEAGGHYLLQTQPVGRKEAVASQLWAAVGKGNTLAEIQLARLYLNGKGVPKSCAQARVLLHSAWRSGNIEALQELRQMAKKGCR